VTATRRDERIDGAYWQYVLEHHLEPSHALEECYWAAWKAGGRQTFHDCAQLADVVPTMRAMLNAVRELLDRLEVDE
jgi:hypothetical protein